MAKSNTNPTTLMAATKSAINKAKYYTTKEKKALALKLLAQLTAEVEALEVVVPKAKKVTVSAPHITKSSLSKMKKAELLALLAEGMKG
jgi:hypothetical protein